MAIKTRVAAREALIDIERLSAEVFDWAEEERPRLRGKAAERMSRLEAETQTIQSTALFCQDVIEEDMDEGEGEDDDC